MPRAKEKPDDASRRLGPSGNPGDNNEHASYAGSLLLDQARRRLDETLSLLEWALDLRLLVWCGLDLAEAEHLVAELRRDVERRLRR